MKSPGTSIDPMGDPMGYTVPLPLRARWYPLGFPVEVFTNSADILEAAEDAWRHEGAPTGEGGAETSRSGSIPAEHLVLRVHITPANGEPLPKSRMPRGQGHLVSVVYSPDHFAVCDVAAGFAFASLTFDAAADHAWTRYHFLEFLIWMMLDARHSVRVHASCVSLGGRAVLLSGESGAGKTSLAYACARRGWTFLSGDATHMIRSAAGFEVRGRPGTLRFRASAKELFPELAGYQELVAYSGKLDVAVSPQELGLTVAASADAAHIVFIERVPGLATAQLQPCSADRAAGCLNDLMCYGDARIQEEQKATLNRFLTLPLWTLRYDTLESAEAALRTLLTGQP